MGDDIPRYLIENHGPDQDAIKTAFAGAIEVCRQHGISDITLLVPHKGNFPSTAVGAFLGAQASKSLCDGNRLQITDDLWMTLCSPKTFAPYQSYGMLIGVYLSKTHQNVLDSVATAQAIVLLPWTEEEGKAWLSTWDAKVLGKSTWQATPPAFPEDVEGALQQLTRTINLSTGLLHSSDKDSAKRTFSELQAAGHFLNSEDIRRWALRNGWPPEHAESLGSLADRYFSS